MIMVYWVCPCLRSILRKSCWRKKAYNAMLYHSYGKYFGSDDSPMMITIRALWNLPRWCLLKCSTSAGRLRGVLRLLRGIHLAPPLIERYVECASRLDWSWRRSRTNRAQPCKSPSPWRLSAIDALSVLKILLLQHPLVALHFAELPPEPQPDRGIR